MIAPQTLLQNRYLVLKQIGQGGMGAVYLATDQRFGSMVALKETFFTDATLEQVQTLQVLSEIPIIGIGATNRMQKSLEERGLCRSEPLPKGNAPRGRGARRKR